MARSESNDSARVSPDNLYRDALTETERQRLDEASAVEALNDEIAALRVRLATALHDHPEDLRLALYGMNTLMRMVVAQYRLSPRASQALADNLTAVLNSFADQMVPADH